MIIELPPETEMKLADEARRCHVSVAALVERLDRDNLASPGFHRPGVIPKLPAFDLGVMGTLHRRDIYDDADLSPSLISGFGSR